jgi:hypothetical protein
MSNIFKSNSRFAGLMDEPEYDDKSVKIMKNMGWKEGKGLGKNLDGMKTPIQTEKRENNSGLGFKNENGFNSFKDNGFTERRYSRYPSEREREKYQAEEQAKKEFEKREEERRQQESLKLENFPELVTNAKEYEVVEENSYIEKLKQANQLHSDNKSVDPDLDNLKAGWILLKRAKLTGKIITKYKAKPVETNVIKEDTSVIDTINALVDLHERRTQEYIELNGYDIWEKNFKFANWKEWEAEYESDSDYDEDCDDEDEEDYDENNY